MLISLNNIMETILNPNGRFQTLKDIYSVAGEDGMPVMTCTSLSVEFKVIYDKEEYTLKCLRAKALQNKSGLKDISAFCNLINSPHITVYDYRESEMMIYNEAGEKEYLDVIMQKTPEGYLLSELLKQYSNNNDTPKLTELIKQLAALAGWITNNNFSHGRISAQNIYIGHDNTPVLINYERTKRHEPREDIERLAVLCSAIYLTACDTRFYPHLAGTCYTSMTQAISDIVNTNSPKELKELTNKLEKGKYKKVKTLCELIQKLSECMPTKIDSLSKMLDNISPISGSNISPEKHTVTKKKYEFIGEYHDNLAMAFDGEKWCYINRAGQVVIDGEFRDARMFYEGRAIVETVTGYGAIDQTGKFRVKPVFEDLEIDPSGCFVIATQNGLSGLLTRDGSYITQMEFDQILPSSEGMSPVKKGNKFGFINKDGNIVIPIEYDDVYKFTNGVAKVFLKGREYVVDKEGNTIDEILSVNQ